MGISVIDILPFCVSSVYFIWDPAWAWASLGKSSAMREAALVMDMRDGGAKGMDWVYMGTVFACNHLFGLNTNLERQGIGSRIVSR